ncbi:hypothetical protein HDU82_007978, partial [Entophlyctis luteolus]
MAHRRKKRRTHVVAAADPENQASAAAAVPKSFVIRAGGGRGQARKASPALKQLVLDWRAVMEPNTASNIKEQRANKLKDFVHVAGQLGVTHLVMLGTRESRSHGDRMTLRTARLPRGPTLSFNVRKYALAKDVRAAQSRPMSPGSADFKTAPLIVLNNFNSDERHMKLVASMFQNMFPPINVQQMKLADARRVVLFSFDAADSLIEMRHYSISVKLIGISKSVKSVISTNIPDLNKYDDVADYVL